MRNPEDKTQLTLVFANVSEDDILLKKELDDMAKKHSNFNVSSNSGVCLCSVGHLYILYGLCSGNASKPLLRLASVQLIALLGRTLTLFADALGCSCAVWEACSDPLDTCRCTMSWTSLPAGSGRAARATSLQTSSSSSCRRPLTRTSFWCAHPPHPPSHSESPVCPTHVANSRCCLSVMCWGGLWVLDQRTRLVHLHPSPRCLLSAMQQSEHGLYGRACTIAA